MDNNKKRLSISVQQAKVLTYIYEYQNKYGKTPAINTIRKGVGLNEQTQVKYALSRLKKRGWIDYVWRDDITELALPEQKDLYGKGIMSHLDAKIFAAIIYFQKTHGFKPTTDDICTLSNTRAIEVYKAVQRLEDSGYIKPPTHFHAPYDVLKMPSRGEIDADLMRGMRVWLNE